MTKTAQAFRFPDMPRLSTTAILPMLRDGEWLAQFKPNGFRCHVRWNGSLIESVTSRHRKPVDCSGDAMATLAAHLQDCPPALLDGEWMGRRGGFAERFWLFDLLELGGEWLGRETCLTRFEMLEKCLRGRAEKTDPLIRHTLEDYPGFFAAARAARTEGVEGIVLKRTDSIYCGSYAKCVENPGWKKVKFLGGEDGETVIA